MKIILIGAPGAGKGTQAEKLAKVLRIPRLTTGDLFRQAVQEQSSLGNKVKDILDRGALVSDNVVLALMGERMSKPDAKQGFVLDGFPRTLGQAKGLEEWLEEEKLALDYVIALDVSDQEAIQRITGRRQCNQCGAAYHLTFQPPKEDGVCEGCGGVLKQRRDDEEATVRHRLEVYKEQTAPLLKFYENKGLLRTLNGSLAVEEVFRTICSLIK